MIRNAQAASPLNPASVSATTALPGSQAPQLRHRRHVRPSGVGRRGGFRLVDNAVLLGTLKQRIGRIAPKHSPGHAGH